MATILLSAAGAALGSGFGGTVLGLSGAAIGRAVGATLGRVIDQRLLGGGSDAIEAGRIDRFRLMGASEGTAIPRVWGRIRVPGQVIWATRFREVAETSGGGKGRPQPAVTAFSYSVSLAIALCEGRIAGIGRVWADGAEVDLSTLDLRVYPGSATQLPDPKIEAVEGAGRAPAYRGTAYVVIEDLALAPFGNRVPQLSFEVIRAAQGPGAARATDMAGSIRGVALIPGTGEYALATTAVRLSEDPGLSVTANQHAPEGGTDLEVSLRQMERQLPRCDAVSLVVSWFGDDLRCGQCRVRPKVEQTALDGVEIAWRAGGIGRAEAQEVARIDGRPVYGGTPSDASVIEAIRRLRARGRHVTFYPFILMEQLAGNGRPDPWSDAEDQPVLPWRGRITLAKARGQAGSPDGTGAAAAQVADFFGTAQPGDFAADAAGRVTYAGPGDFRYRRFILHYATLCAAAGGVDAFCIGSEMVALTQARGAAGSFPAVAALRALAADVRAILGPSVRIGYAADWSEYFGLQAGNDRVFHLDPLWADANVDFIGIDNYMPLSDWRDGDGHRDAAAGTIYDLAYLRANVAGGEGYDWYYDSDEARARQARRPIEDGAYGEPWVFRYKDLKSWWSLPHHDRIGGVRAAQPTAWVPGSKPIWFTELGCPAIDKGTNQPNKFVDPKSSESSAPWFSTGRRDDLIQMQYLRAMAEHWADPEANPAASAYAGRMVDMARAHVWAWDARPFPQFPGLRDVWSDGDNYARGHWLNGRATNQTLAAVVAEICEAAGVTAYDVSGLHGLVRGYVRDSVEPARAALQPLMLAHGFDVAEREGVLRFTMRTGRADVPLDPGSLAVSEELDGDLVLDRAAEAETAGHVRVAFVESEGDYEPRQAEAVFPDGEQQGVSLTEMAMVLTGAEARGMAERWLSESRIARDTARFALPPSAIAVGAGDVVDLAGSSWRVDRVEVAGHQLLEAVRVETGVFLAPDVPEAPPTARPHQPAMPVEAQFLDLPLLTGGEVPHAPRLAVAATPWPGRVGVWSGPADDGYALDAVLTRAATIGVTEGPLAAAQPGLWDRGSPLPVRLFGGELGSATEEAVLGGANALAIGDGSPDRWEVLQFAEAVLTGPRRYALSRRLRGQAGTDALMPPVWPAGSRIVLLDSAVRPLDLRRVDLGVERHYRIGAAARGYADPAVAHRTAVFDGIGLRPYAPVALRATSRPDGSVDVAWIRRTRLDGDAWGVAEVPLSEAAERYRIEVRAGGALVREAEVGAPAWTYEAGAIAADGAARPFDIAVAQVSDRFGPGLYRTVTVR